MAGFKSCEMTMQRRDVHACHAGLLVHALEKWTHHEVKSQLSVFWSVISGSFCPKVDKFVLLTQLVNLR